ncbi:putative prophage protein [Escherichia coli]|nr:putative prophage protein [Escherichia coli]
MNNFLTFHAEATPDGVNIMYRSNDGMTERVETVSYIDAVNRLDAGIMTINQMKACLYISLLPVAATRDISITHHSIT